MIEENHSYTTVSGEEVTITKEINHDKSIILYSKEMLEILWTKNPWWEERKNLTQKQEVVEGKTNDKNMPKWHRHKQTGKCLWLSRGNGIEPELNKYRSKFDILDHQKNH